MFAQFASMLGCLGNVTVLHVPLNYDGYGPYTFVLPNIPHGLMRLFLAVLK